MRFNCAKASSRSLFDHSPLPVRRLRVDSGNFGDGISRSFSESLVGGVVDAPSSVVGNNVIVTFSWLSLTVAVALDCRRALIRTAVC